LAKKRLLSLLLKLVENKNLIYIYFYSNEHVVLRNATDKVRRRWNISPEEYSADFYPPYFSGTLYAASRGAAACILQVRINKFINIIPIVDTFYVQ